MDTHSHPTVPPTVSRAEWLLARKALLAREKELTRARDRLAAERRTLPRVAMDKAYLFEGPEGPATLADLFDGRSQLIVYHFMLGPDAEEGCPGCSFLVDNIGHLAHLHARDTTLVLVSRAPLEEIERFKARMGWTLPWVSSNGSDFNYDFHVTLDDAVAPVEYNYETAASHEGGGRVHFTRGEQPGLSVFLKEDGAILHTYSAYSRGLDILDGTYHLLDMTPYGRQEGVDGDRDLNGEGLGWTRLHDRYGDGAAASHCCPAEKNRAAAEH